jgi:phage-related protein
MPPPTLPPVAAAVAEAEVVVMEEEAEAALEAALVRSQLVRSQLWTVPRQKRRRRLCCIDLHARPARESFIAAMRRVPKRSFHCSRAGCR